MQSDRHSNFPFFILSSHTSLTVAFLNRLQREESEVSAGISAKYDDKFTHCLLLDTYQVTSILEDIYQSACDYIRLLLFPIPN